MCEYICKWEKLRERERERERERGYGQSAVYTKSV